MGSHSGRKRRSHGGLETFLVCREKRGKIECASSGEKAEKICFPAFTLNYLFFSIHFQLISPFTFPSN